MAVQPCGCGSNEKDWPYNHADFDPEETSGFHCGVDGEGDSLFWAYPGPEHGGFVASKAAASGIASGAWIAIPGPYTEPTGGAHHASGVFTAPRGGIYGVTFFFEPGDSAVDEAFTTWGRVSSSYAPWSSPYLKQIAPSVIFLGSGCTVAGDLPCAKGGTLTYEVFHNKGSNTNFKNIYLSAFWKCPIPS